MSTRLVIDGNDVYEIDEDCERKRSGGRISRQSMQEPKNNSSRGRQFPDQSDSNP